MSRDMHMYLEHYNKEQNKWEAVQLFAQSHYEYYAKEGVREVAFIAGGWNDAMDILTDTAYNGYPDFSGAEVIHFTNTTKDICDKTFGNISEGIKKHYEKLFDEEGKLKVGYFDLGIVNVADIVTYIAKYPEVEDYYSEAEGKAPNPFVHIIDRINMFADLCDIWFNSYSEFRLVFWGDC